MIWILVAFAVLVIAWAFSEWRVDRAHDSWHRILIARMAEQDDER